jgi:DNA-directed RNA polymerase subunit RPC12/RpoP
MNKIIHEDTEDIICPYCGVANNDEKSELEFESDTECVGCGKEFEYQMTITYTTNKK